MPRYIDADILLKSLQETAEECHKWVKRETPTISKELKEQSYVTFLECILRVKSMPTEDVAPLIRARWDGMDSDGDADGDPVYNSFICR